MKESICLFFIISLLTNAAWTQPKAGSNENQVKGMSNAISSGLDIGLANFSDTHFWGAGLDYSWTRHRYGQLYKIPSRIIGFTANAGIDYFFGRKETIDSFKYRYSNYMLLHGYGGIIYNPCKKGNISLAAGPLAGIYKGYSNIGYGITLEGSYYISENMAITPGIMMLKLPNSYALYAATIRGSFIF
jgi:hypothetical protein